MNIEDWKDYFTPAISSLIAENPLPGNINT
jgi:hypothetical protein